MSAPSGPNTVRMPFRSPLLAALTRASTASSAVLKDCWAFATDAIAKASTAAVNEASLASEWGGIGQRENRDHGILGRIWLSVLRICEHCKDHRTR